MLMGDIYGNASEIILWLGLEGNDSEMAIQTLKWLAKYFVEKNVSSIDSADFPRHRGDFATVRAIIDPLELGYRPSNQMPPLPLLTFPKRPWWERVWTIQEIALARRVHISCGFDMLVGEE